jgi:hypothetical protein
MVSRIGAPYADSSNRDKNIQENSELLKVKLQKNC